MKRTTDGTNRCAWSSAQVPRLVQGHVLPDAPVAPAAKQREAEELRAAVDAHIAQDGAYQILPAPGAKS